MPTCIPLKSSFASVYHRANFFYPLYHSVHLPLRFSALRALIDGTRLVKCLFYPLRFHVPNPGSGVSRPTNRSNTPAATTCRLQPSSAATPPCGSRRSRPPAPLARLRRRPRASSVPAAAGAGELGPGRRGQVGRGRGGARPRSTATLHPPPRPRSASSGSCRPAFSLRPICLLGFLVLVFQQSHTIISSL